MRLSKEARKLRQEYLKEWRRKNPDKVKKHTQNYWERKAQGMKVAKES